MVGSPSNMVGLTHLQPLIAACIGDIVPPFSHTVLLCCWFQNQNIFSAFRSAPTYGDFGQQNQHLSVKLLNLKTPAWFTNHPHKK
jgi:hypothetical protein